MQRYFLKNLLNSQKNLNFYGKAMQYCRNLEKKKRRIFNFGDEVFSHFPKWEVKMKTACKFGFSPEVNGSVLKTISF